MTLALYPAPTETWQRLSIALLSNCARAYYDKYRHKPKMPGFCWSVSPQFLGRFSPITAFALFANTLCQSSDVHPFACRRPARWDQRDRAGLHWKHGYYRGYFGGCNGKHFHDSGAFKRNRPPLRCAVVHDPVEQMAIDAGMPFYRGRQKRISRLLRILHFRQDRPPNQYGFLIRLRFSKPGLGPQGKWSTAC